MDHVVDKLICAGFNNLQKWARSLAVYPDARSSNAIETMYLALGFSGEAGEVGNYAKKDYRDGCSEKRDSKMREELGDAIWYALALCDAKGWNLWEIIVDMVDKLEGRKSRGTLHGSGDR